MKLLSIASDNELKCVTDANIGMRFEYSTKICYFHPLHLLQGKALVMFTVIGRRVQILAQRAKKLGAGAALTRSFMTNSQNGNPMSLGIPF
jgi:hypothetical protein